MRGRRCCTLRRNCKESLRWPLCAEERLVQDQAHEARSLSTTTTRPWTLSLDDTWDDYNFAQAEAAAAAMELEQAEIAAASASQVVYSIDEQGGASRSWASSAA